MAEPLSSLRTRWHESRLRASIVPAFGRLAVTAGRVAGWGRAKLRNRLSLNAPLGTPYDDDEDAGKAKKGRRMFRAGLVLVSLSITWGLLTLFILTNLTPITGNNAAVWLISGSAVLILAMITLVAWQIIGLWRARRRQQAGAGLHVRIVSLFSAVALFPAILLAVFATISIDRGIDRFSTRTRTIVKNSVNVANAYLAEHSKILGAHGIGMARDLEDNAQLLKDNPDGFRSFAAALAIERRVPFAFLIDAEGHSVIELMTAADHPFVAPPAPAITAAHDGHVVELGIYSPGARGDVRMLKKLSNFDNLYLYIARPVDSTVSTHLQATQANVKEYEGLESRRSGVQMAFALMYGVIALTLLLASIWIGLSFANRLVAPIRRLIGAAQDVSRGNLGVAVKVESPRSDMGRLSATFNRMTTELRSQRNALIGANTKLDERRRFMEAVLSGVTAGVIGVDANGLITLANSSATLLLGRDEKDLIGRPIAEAVPEFATIAAKAPKHSRKAVQSQITYRREGSDLTFSVRVTQEGAGRRDYGFVVTFDDITEVVIAQRTTAWADVAQRIAHEIKNPLTPIQLSAERIRRKYGALITTDREVFDRCTDTIIRHVGDIGRMVDEFSSFARMPKPVFEHHDAGSLVREAVILFQMSNLDIDYGIDVPENPFIVECDRRLLTQAVTNLVKNAGEAIATKISGKKSDTYRGQITAKVHGSGNRCLIEVIDNGCGLPVENRQRLVEPYVTTRQKGTGLGLAIVQRIAEQHEGRLELEDAFAEAGEVCGATVRLVIPVTRSADAAEIVEVPDEQAKHRLDGGNEGVSYGV